MMRTPLYGGRGIRNRGDKVTTDLRIFAKSDFAHDFGEGVPARDQFTQDDNVRFVEIAQRFGVGRVKALTAGFDAVNGKNPYVLIKNNISTIYPGVSGDESEFIDESSVLLMAGIDYDGKVTPNQKKEITKITGMSVFPTVMLKDQLKAQMSGKKKEDILKTPLKLNQKINIPGEPDKKWDYTITAVPMKDSAKKTPNISAMFHRVTGGKTEFALIIDAAGGLTLSSLKNSDIGPVPDAKCKFYIIENIENDSDSATKLKNFDKPKDKSPEKTSMAPEVQFLKDVQNTVIYPAFNNVTQKEPGEVLFGNAELTLSRAGEEMEADFKFADKSTYHIENVSQNANVKNASLNLLASALAAGGVIDRKDPKNTRIIMPPGSTTKEPFLYPYIKRVGDWCQALSLLDTSRQYQVYDTDHEMLTGEMRTLRQLKESGVAVALVTLDRILLAYALSLGIDVFFTTASDLTLLLYFKNNETELTDEQIAQQNTKFQQDIAEFETPAGVAKRSDNSGAVREAATASVAAAVDDADYIRRLRAALYRVSVSRSDFTNLNARVSELKSKIASQAGDAKALHNTYFDLLTILRKMDVDHRHNDDQIAGIGTYPGIEEDDVHYDIMRKRPSRNSITRIKVIISKEMYNDILQTNDLFKTLYREPVNREVYGPIWTSFGDILGKLKLPKKGGADEDITMDDSVQSHVESLHQFEVTPLTKSEYNAALNDPARIAELEKLPLALIIASFYRDKKMLPYTVVDKYVITKEDIGTFENIIADPSSISDDEMRDIALRFVLLYADILRAKYEKLVLSEDDYQNVTEDGVFISSDESDVKFAYHKRIHYQANKLLETVEALSASPLEAFKTAFNDMKTADTMENDELERLAQGRGAVRQNNYKQTCDKIETARVAILMLLGIDIKPFPACDDVNEPVDRTRISVLKSNSVRRTREGNLQTLQMARLNRAAAVPTAKRSAKASNAPASIKSRTVRKKKTFINADTDMELGGRRRTYRRSVGK